MFDLLKKYLLKKENLIFFSLFTIAFFFSFFIFLILSGYIKHFNDFDKVSNFIIFDLLIILLLIALVFSKVFKIWLSQKEKKLGSNFHAQMSILFAFITLIPSITVTIFSVVFFDQGIKSWFDEKVKTAISGSKFISESYFKEHSNNLKNDLIALNNEINNEKIAFFTNKERLTKLLESLVIIKLIDEAIIFERSGQLLAKVGKTFLISEEPPPPLWSLFRADEGETPIFTNKENNKVRGLIKLDRVIPTYLYIGKTVDSFVLNRVESVNTATNQYLNLEKNIDKFQNQFYQLFVAINLLVILLSVWLGLLLANKIILPIKIIIAASKRISSGNYKTKINSSSQFRDFNVLSKSLNKMVEILLEQRNKLFKAKENLDLRRKFTETVIEGVSAGVLYIDFKYQIRLFNKKSEELLDHKLNNKNIVDVLPQSIDILDQIKFNDLKTKEKQLHINKGGYNKIINLKITPELKSKKIIGFIITFDDLTELMFAQKQAAWSNIARYLAHEIKNPLTPINLSAQRLQSSSRKRKLTTSIIENCTDTIVRQVNDIKKLVTEFSEFARMPECIFVKLDVIKLIFQQIDNQKIINQNIKFKIKNTLKSLIIECDSSRINRLFINIIKNAVESIASQKKKIIFIEISTKKSKFNVKIEDNGVGFPPEKEKLFEPYITNKKDGTGLGLSICKKIIEEHQGEISLYKSIKLGGAGVDIKLPVTRFT